MKKAKIISAALAAVLALTMASCGSDASSVDKSFGTITEETVGDKLVYSVHIDKADYAPDYQPCTEKKLSGMKLLEIVSRALSADDFLDAKGLNVYTDASLIYDSEQEISDAVNKGRTPMSASDIRLDSLMNAHDKLDVLNERLAEAIHTEKGENAEVPEIEDAWMFGAGADGSSFVLKINGEWKAVLFLEEYFAGVYNE